MIEVARHRRQLALASAMILGGNALIGCGGEAAPDLGVQVCNDELPSSGGTVVVDGRCDLDPMTPIGIYPQPEQIADTAFAQAATGAELTATCVVEGEELQDLSELASGIWVQIDLASSQKELEILVKNIGDGPGAYIPGIWVDGEEKLEAC